VFNYFVSYANNLTNSTNSTNINLTNSTNSTNVSNISKPVQTNFTNQTIVSNVLFLKNVRLLHDMGYLPLTPISENGNVVTWQWDYPSIPEQLQKLTPTGPNSILYQAATKAFQNDTGMIATYNNLSLAFVNNYKSRKPFTWILVNKSQPERIKVWQTGSYVLESNCNTGIREGLTPNGSFIIYARYRKFTMSGRWPLNDRPYYDPDVPYVNFFYRGDAIHGFPRASYGYPQSAGCVEIPISFSKQLFQFTYIGTIVTITQ
jgi:hypothetical protein